MSSKSRRAGGKEKWVSGNEFKFETPQKMPKKTRQGRHLSIPSPWMHKLNTQVKPGQVFSGKKTQMKKPSTHIMKKRSQSKRVRIFLDEESKSKKEKLSSSKTSKNKSLVVPLRDVDLEKDDIYTVVKNKDLVDNDEIMDVSFNYNQLSIQPQNEILVSPKQSIRKSSIKSSPANLTDSNNSRSKKTRKYTSTNKIVLDIAHDEDMELKPSELMTNGDHHDNLMGSSPNNMSVEDLTTFEEVITEELVKPDADLDPKKASAAPEKKPVKSWCSIA